MGRRRAPSPTRVCLEVGSTWVFATAFDCPGGVVGLVARRKHWNASLATTTGIASWWARSSIPDRSRWSGAVAGGCTVPQTLDLCGFKSTGRKPVHTQPPASRLLNRAPVPGRVQKPRTTENLPTVGGQRELPAGRPPRTTAQSGGRFPPWSRSATAPTTDFTLVMTNRSDVSRVCRSPCSAALWSQDCSRIPGRRRRLQHLGSL
jgi:hypothetical protein